MMTDTSGGGGAPPGPPGPALPDGAPLPQPVTAAAITNVHAKRVVLEVKVEGELVDVKEVKKAGRCIARTFRFVNYWFKWQ